MRVLETIIGPGERTAVHTHRWPMTLQILSRSDFVRYDGDGRMEFDSRTHSAGNPPQRFGWLEPLGPHALENVGSNVLHVISVEIKQ